MAHAVRRQDQHCQLLLLLLLLQINVGKGGEWLFSHLMQQYQLQPSHTAMIGDRLDTDIAMGKQGGLMTLLPLTGEPGCGCNQPTCAGASGSRPALLQWHAASGAV